MLFITSVEWEQFLFVVCFVILYTPSTIWWLGFENSLTSWLSSASRFLQCDNIIFWRVFCAFPSPILCLVLTFCKVLWSVDFNFKHSIYFCYEYLLCSVESLFFFFGLTLLYYFLWISYWVLVFSHWYVLGFISTGTPNWEAKTILWQVSLTIIDFMIALCSPPSRCLKSSSKWRCTDQILSTPHLSASKLPCASGTYCCFLTWTLKSLEFRDSCFQRSLLVSHHMSKEKCILNTHLLGNFFLKKERKRRRKNKEKKKFKKGKLEKKKEKKNPL